MRKLILIKHSVPQQLPSVPARDWRLSEAGRRRCSALAALLSRYHPGCLAASKEPKATETARLVAGALGLSYQLAEGLHEHDRSEVGYLGREEFESAIAGFFARPHELIFGKESADAAARRFSAAVQQVIEPCDADDIMIVAHGTVISLFVAQMAGLDPLDLWRRLDLPSFVVLSLPDYRMIEIVDQIA
jgi:broad specificity phosphatase PhoE